jgi:hypothetical protein
MRHCRRNFVLYVPIYFAFPLCPTPVKTFVRLLTLRDVPVVCILTSLLAVGPRGCSGHGACNQNTGKCQCDPLWDVLPSCRVKGCASNCTNGACVDGVCECNPGFLGPSCDDFTCLNGCSGHGVCRYLYPPLSMACSRADASVDCSGRNS